MFLFQVLMALFAFFMVYVLRIHFRRGHLSPVEFGAWLAVWFCFVLLSLFPQTLRGVSDTLRIGRVFDLLVITAFGILSVAVFVTRLTVLELRKKLDSVVRQQAIFQATQRSRRRVS